MTVLMDRFFSKMGLEEQQLKHSSQRGFLYIGMIFMLGITFAFLIMAMLS